MAALLWDPRHDRSVRLRLGLIHLASVSSGLKEACNAAAEPWRGNRNVAVRRRAGLRPRACARGPLQAHDRSTYAEDGRGRCEAPPNWWTPLLSSGGSGEVSNGPGTASFYG